MQLEHQTVDVTSDPEAYFNQFGKLALLIGTTPQFSKVQMDVGLSLVHAALMHKSYCLYVDAEGKPTAGLVWAYLNDETVASYLKYGMLPDFEAWRSGDQLWLLNVVAKGGLIKQVFNDTMSTLFKDEKEAFMLRPSPSGRRRIVRITHDGAEVVKVLPAPKKEQDQD